MKIFHSFSYAENKNQDGHTSIKRTADLKKNISLKKSTAQFQEKLAGQIMKNES